MGLDVLGLSIPSCERTLSSRLVDGPTGKGGTVMVIERKLNHVVGGWVGVEIGH